MKIKDTPPNWQSPLSAKRLRDGSVLASAPSNIALIKYMGKTSSRNEASNPSLSVTLAHLRSFVRLKEDPQTNKDYWQPFESFEDAEISPQNSIELSDKSVERFLTHLKRCKDQFGISQNFQVSSVNNFPSDCGLASSASSFAALTSAVGFWLSQASDRRESALDLALLSRQGSGSSCRSFFEPMALWDGDRVEAVFPGLKWIHSWVVVDSSKKKVSSSQAHERVKTSLLMTDRGSRVKARIADLMKALDERQFENVAQICWEEFWDMHSLFETSRPSFGYLNEGSLRVLRHVREFWDTRGFGPITTMDAGANVHFLFPDQKVDSFHQWAEHLKAHGHEIASQEKLPNTL